LRLLQWTCDEDCRYECSRNHTDYRRARDEPPLQYFGKWPFVRVLGTQEWFSSIFSLGNLVPAIWAVIVLMTDLRCRLAPHRVRLIYLYYALTACLAWTCSAWFHARDNKLSELADYAMSDLFIVTGATVAVYRLLNVRHMVSIALVHGIGFAVFVAQVTYLVVIKFDYGWNTTWAVLVNCITSIGWIIYVVKWWGKRPYVWKLAWFHALCWLAAMNEFFDYAPFYDLLDAHAIWHGATIPLAGLTWSFIVDDCRFEGSLEDARHKIE